VCARTRAQAFVVDHHQKTTSFTTIEYTFYERVSRCYEY